jgi:hypothetical protein
MTPVEGTPGEGGTILRLGHRTFRRTLQTWAKKALLITLCASVIWVLDDLQVRYLSLARFGNGAEIAYQACFLLASAAVAYGVLHRRSWNLTRNLSNLLMALPVAALADNVSIDMGTLKLYLILIPREGYVWRQAVFGNTVGLSYVAGWVNQQSIAPSLLNGYVASIVLAVAYILIQFVWSSRDSAWSRPSRVSEPAAPSGST